MPRNTHFTVGFVFDDTQVGNHPLCTTILK